MKRTQPGEGKRARTRAKLIEAALCIVEEAGLRSASLDAIASRAGMTKGAIYSNFSNRAELLLAVAQARGLTLTPAVPTEPGVSGLLSAYAEAVVDAVARAQPQAEFIADLQAEAVHDPDLRAALGTLHSKGFAYSAMALHASGMGMSEAERLAVALQAAALGLLLQSLLTPKEITPELIYAVVANLPR